MELFQASKEWRSRPEDQRFLTLADLKASVDARRKNSWTISPRCSDLRVENKEGDLGIMVFDPTVGEDRQLKPTNWSFNQLSQFAGAPASYLRNLHPQITAINLQYGLETVARDKSALILGQSDSSSTEAIRAMTSTSYGRIYDSQVVDSVIKANQSGRWEIPASSYAATNPKRATTLYASDRDVFIFLVDPKNPIEVGNEVLYRGFFAWNSEVGACTFGLATFLYRHVCDNRIVWGATEVQELRIRHTSGAPERFAYEGQKFLTRYANESAGKLIEGIKKAKETPIPLGRQDTLDDWLKARKFTQTEIKGIVETAKAEEGEARSVWDIINGATAYARSIPNSNDRVDLETRASKLMSLVV